MTHDLRRDAAVLRSVAERPPAYLGILGPKRRTARLLSAITATGDGVPDWIYAPVGLDIGGDTPEMIALSISAEIQAVFGHRVGGPLRDRVGPIHAPLDGVNAGVRA